MTMQEATTVQMKVGSSYWSSLGLFKIILTNKQKAVIENDINEKGWNADMAVHNLIKKIAL